MGSGTFVSSKINLSRSVHSDSPFSPYQQLATLPSGQHVHNMVVEDGGVWVSVGDSPIVHLYHALSATLMTTVDCTRAVVDLLRGKAGCVQTGELHSRPMKLLLARSEGRGSGSTWLITRL